MKKVIKTEANAQKAIAERIEELEAIGFKRWQKGTIDRLYISADVLGLEVEYNKSGSIWGAWFQGKEISHAEGYRMKAAKTYIDVIKGKVYSDNDTLKEAAEKLAKLA